MSQYILFPDGSIKKKDNNNIVNVDFKDVLSTIGNSLKDNKPSENINRFFITSDIIPDLFSNNEESKSKEYVVGTSSELVNKSYDFINENFIEKKDSEFKKVKYYRSYNSVFDLELNNNETGFQLFAHELDFHGFTNDSIRNIVESIEETILRLIAVTDMIIAAAIPIITISVLQSLLQDSQNSIPELFFFNQNKFEFGKYITYKNFTDDQNLRFILLEKTLNSFERLMNFPSFKKNDLLNFLSNIGYFITGYTSYLTPGLKINFPNSFTGFLLFIPEFIITSAFTSNSSRHIFNLLIRKIARNNYFLKSFLDSPSISIDSIQYSLIRNFSILGSFFFRFIGERISVGEKIYKIQYPSQSLQQGNFFLTRYKDLYNSSDKKQSENEDELNIKNNNLLTSFRFSNSNGDKKVDILNIFSKINKNTNDLYQYTSGVRLKRIDKETQKSLEKDINSEYMPFSIHDLRTNEIFSFHAFLENVSDSFSPNFTTSTGYGRMDPVKIYENTTRSINVDFWLISTSPEDHDYMWYYINRLVSCIYPQWSKPELTNEENSKQINLKFGNPFTQIPVAPPTIRLRVGDLIKSNYTEKNLIRQFDFGNIDINSLSIISNFDKEFKEIELINFPLKNNDIQNNKLEKINNFFNNFNFKHISSLYSSTISFFQNNNNIKKEDLLFEEEFNNNDFQIDNKFLVTNQIINIKNIIEKNFVINSIEVENINKIKVLIMSKETSGNQKLKMTEKKGVEDILIKNYLDTIEKSINDNLLCFYIFYKVNLEYINEKNEIKEYSFYIFSDYLNKGVSDEIKRVSDEEKEKIKNFLNENNVIKNTFESIQGEGIVGFIKNINVGIDNNILWDIEKNKIAPMAVKIGLQFDPIHDIPLGLDYKGVMRAAAYSVGKVNKYLFVEK